MATIKEVARRAGVSVGTVSNVLSNLPTVAPDLRKRVERAIEQLSYRPNQVARSLKKQTTETLGLVISDIANPFFSAIVRGAEDEAASHGYMLSIFNTDDQMEKEARVLEVLEGRRVDGILLVPALQRGESGVLRRLLVSGTPLVCIDRELEDPALPSRVVDAVLVDNRGGVAEGVKRLLASGAKRIAYLGGQPGQYIARERLAGFESALQSAGIRKEPSLIWTGDFKDPSGYRAVKEKYATTRPDALFAANMLMCLGALRAFGEIGVAIPQDLQIVSFDHFEILDSFHPRLSSMAQPTYEIGRQAVKLLLARLKDRTAPAQRIVLEAQWKPGETTRP
jgi:LacI family transcriptional regulator